VEAVLAELGLEFEAMYAATGRHSVPPEPLLKATVLMALYSIRSERQFCERLRYDLLFKFFLDLTLERRRHPAQGLGVAQELPAQGRRWAGRPSGAGTECRGGP
jgi:hypothetical protein